MPRADPARSDYCASRHLLRNLDDARQLRRNPLTRAHFARLSAHARDPDADRAALARIRGLVREALACAGEHADDDRRRIDRGRLHTALLRCEIDEQPLAVVAAELGLSERQLRRERRSAHDAFMHALRRGAQPPATVQDVAALRMAQAVELHELGQSDVALRTLASIASTASEPIRRAEALAAAAEACVDLDDDAAAAAHDASAVAQLAACAGEADARARLAVADQLDFVAWRRRIDRVSGLSTAPPAAVTRGGDDTAGDERSRALLVRALAAYTIERVEIGDLAAARPALSRAESLLSTLAITHPREELAVRQADVHVHSFSRPASAAILRWTQIEERARRAGHVRVRFTARAALIYCEYYAGLRRTIADALLEPFGAHERRIMPRELLFASVCFAETSDDIAARVRTIKSIERIAPPGSPNALTARMLNICLSFESGRYDDAFAQAETVRLDAEHIGNPRMQGSAACRLAAAALAQNRRRDARRYIDEALPLLERHGVFLALNDARVIATRVARTRARCA